MLLNDRDAGFKQGRVAPKLIDQDPDNQRAILGVQHGMRTDQGRNDTPAINIADETDRSAGAAGEAHVRNVTSPQVDLSRAAGAFDDDEIVRGDETPEALHNGCH